MYTYIHMCIYIYIHTYTDTCTYNICQVAEAAADSTSSAVISTPGSRPEASLRS